MKNNIGLCFVVLMAITDGVWAYGSPSGSTACQQPKFSGYNPADKTDVNAGSSFSFTASANALPTTIKVVVKNIPTPVTVIPKSDGSLLVNGLLPVSLKNTFARIAITADGKNNCPGVGGWLVKIN